MINVRSISDVLAVHAARIPEKVVYYMIDAIGEEVSITYKELDIRVNMYADYLKTNGIEKGSTCMLSMPQSIEFIVAFLACNRIGAIAIPINMMHKNKSVDRWRNIATDSNIKCIITTFDKEEEVAATIAKNSDFPQVPVLTVSIDEELDINKKVKCNHNEIAFLQYTSGSTSFPKGVMVTNKSLLSNEKALSETIGFTENSVMVTWLPFYHDMGLIYGILQPLYSGGEAAIMSPITFVNNPMLWIECIAKHKGTHIAAPNFAYELTADVLERTKPSTNNSLASLKKLDCGSEPVNINTLIKFNKQAARFGLKEFLKPAYGLAESTLLVSAYRPHQKYSKWLKVDNNELKKNKIKVVDKGYVNNKMQLIDENDNRYRYILGNGYANNDHEILIKDEEANILSYNHLGEICAVGNSVTKGYLNKVDENKKSFPIEEKKVCLHTGDLGFMDEEGDLFVVGRIKDLIIIRGMNYYPQDLERASFFADEKLRKDGCAAFYDEESNKLVLIQEVERTAIRKANFEELATKIRQRILELFNLSVNEIIFVKPMHVPRTTSGKIQRNKAKKLYRTNQINDYVYISTKKVETSVVDNIDSYSSLKGYIKTVIANEVGLMIEDIDYDKTFSEIGVNSIMSLSICDRIEEKLNIFIEESVLFSYPTLNLLTEYLWNCINEPEEKEMDIETLLEMELSSGE